MVGQGLTSESDTLYPWFQALNSFASTDKCDSMVKLQAEIFTSTGRDFDTAFSNSLIIHKENTKETNV